jgi:hypothetical protein
VTVISPDMCFVRCGKFNKNKIVMVCYFTRFLNKIFQIFKKVSLFSFVFCQVQGYNTITGNTHYTSWTQDLQFVLLWSSVQYNLLKKSACLRHCVCFIHKERSRFSLVDILKVCLGVALQPVWGWNYSLCGGGITACVGWHYSCTRQLHYYWF